MEIHILPKPHIQITITTNFNTFKDGDMHDIAYCLFTVHPATGNTRHDSGDHRRS